MKFKHPISKKQFWIMDVRLRCILCALEAGLKMLLDHELTITSIIRRTHDSTGIHSCGRAVDISIKGLSKAQVYQIEYWLNSTFPYDPKSFKYQTALHHDVGYGDHIHIQVPPIK